MIVLMFLLNSGKNETYAIILVTFLLIVAMLYLNNPLTHRVAVAGIVVKDDKVLMLLRNFSPKIWAPPGGHLSPGENPDAGVKREVLEECGLIVEPVRAISVYMGKHLGELLLGISIVCRYISGEIQLSEENIKFKWFDPQLKNPGKFCIENTPALGIIEDYKCAIRVMKDLQS
jgi:8-oxo-dGTP pyrophosphatase MutT (NUDIX family)